VGAQKNTRKSAVVLLSGGLDSATVAAWLQREGFEVIGLSIDYGQRHAVELQAAGKIASALGLDEHLVMRLDMRVFGASALTADIDVPKGGDSADSVAADIPVTYVPARNTIFLSLALGLAESRGAHDLGIGVNALDYSGYPDCRPDFVAKFGELANLATREGVEGRPIGLHTPLLHLSKLEILQLAHELKVPVADTISCYDPSTSGEPCRLCDACRLRAQAEDAFAAQRGSARTD
jgi:7-cyano-7-deazaguanine synthase